MKKIAIVGAGISGLSLAWYLKKRWAHNVQITILEKEQRVGGWIHSTENQGYLFESGPRSFRTSGVRSAVLDLCKDLHIDQQVIQAHEESRKRYILYQGELIKLPGSFLECISTPFMRRFLPRIFLELFTSQTESCDESVGKFFKRHFGDEVVDYLVDPFTAGIWAAHPQSLSVKTCFPYLKRLEEKYGSLIWGMIFEKLLKKKKERAFSFLGSKCNIFSFIKGMHTLPQALAHQFEGEVLTGCNVCQLVVHKERIEIKTNRNTLFADYVFCTVPPYALKSILSLTPLVEIANKISMSSLAIVQAGYAQDVLKEPYRGFGYLSPSCEESRLLGITFDSSIFPQHNAYPSQTRLSVMIGGSRWPEGIKASDQQLTSLAFSWLRNHLNIEKSPDFVQIRRAKDAIALYPLGHIDLLREMEKLLKEYDERIQCVGSGFYGASLGECIEKSYAVAQEFYP